MLKDVECRPISTSAYIAAVSSVAFARAEGKGFVEDTVKIFSASPAAGAAGGGGNIFA